MATRTILSPGVEIREKDLSLVAPNNVGTGVFVTGFADQGPIDEVLQVSSREELELYYGVPTNSAERYFYHTVRELLNSPARIYTSRLPYGAGTGTGFGSKYSALAYPVAAFSLSSYTLNIATSTASTAISSGQFSIVLSDNNTYTFGFSGTTFNPTNTNLNGYALFTTATPYTASTVINAITAAIAQIDTLATFTSAGNALTINPQLPVTNANYTLSALPSGTTGTGNTTTSSNLNVQGGTYILGNPTHLELTQDEYTSIVDGSGFSWSPTASAATAFAGVSNLGGAGVIVLNKAQTTLSDQFEGYYLGITDNLFVNPGTDFKATRGAYTVNTSLNSTRNYVTIPNSTLEFSLTSTVNGPASVSQVMENLTDYDISGREDDDVLGVATVKLRKSLFSTEAFKLDYVFEDRLAGSINYSRDITSAKGGPNVNYFLGNVDDSSRNVEILVNDYISDRLVNSAITNGIPKKKIRVLSQELLNSNDPTASGVTNTFLQGVSASLGFADYLYPLGAYAGGAITDKNLGDIPLKLDRALEGIRNEDIYDIDVIPEAGLGTIYAAASGASTSYYDEFNNSSTLALQVSGLRTTNALGVSGETIRNNYTTIFNRFANFCSPLYAGGGRGDCIFIADPIRQILVTGVNNKVGSNKNSIFQRDIYWAIRHQFENTNTSYATVYANWAKVYDSFIGQQVWVPFSGFGAAAMARTDAATFPWFAPAGFENGLVTGAIDIAVAPNQKQRDELYRSNLNPVTFFPAQGQVIFGQKTLSRKPSAFDRINVRRLFLALERPTRKAAQFFVFQPNTTFTRTRLINTLTPIFERAKNNEGVYDYLIVCDERNNTPQVIDNNELVVDIYIKPVRTSEFILINFVATRTDANFQEIIGA